FDHRLMAVIRFATPQDAPELSRLLTSLGHPTTVGEIGARWDAWQAEGNSALVAVRPDGTLSGAATLHRTWVLHRPRPLGRVTSLIVDEPDRGRGVGRALLAEAERLFTEAGCGLLEITSNVARQDAHAFYLHLGYQQTSARFMKKLTVDR
ncbi:MAG TPA: GNAT family N-acetyltransferase, partial [Candidatus Krumholzibacteria bacterium]|nr:GNAT family N-acetyltransferase [Candidatus Krumholzibacteria bacterium]